MSADLQEQEDELLALQSIYSEEFVREESKFAGKIRLCADIHAEFIVFLTEGESRRQYEISFLPPLLLSFELPEDYPSSSPPSFTLICSWLTHTQLDALSAQLVELYRANGGAVVLFSWVQFLRKDALMFLGICSELEVPSDGGSTLQDKHSVAASEMRINPLISDSKPADAQCGNALNPRKLDISSPDTVLPASCTDSHQSLSNQMEDLLHEEDRSASGLLETSAEGAASLLAHFEDYPQDEDQSLFDVAPSQALLSQILIYDASQKQRVFDSTVFDCVVCFLSYLGSECVQLFECGHIFCQTCLGEFCKFQISEGNVRNVSCPQADCTATPTPAQVKSLVGEELFIRYDRLLLQSTLDSMSDVVYCPRPSCASAVILEKSSALAMCSVCGFAFCVRCKKTYHGTDECTTPKESERVVYIRARKLPESEVQRELLWNDYVTGSKERRRLLEMKYGRDILQCVLEAGLSEGWLARNTKHCPHCSSKIQKIGGCNIMTCTWCKKRFCWMCYTRFSPNDLIYGHFKSGVCTVYSQKTW
ncbi:E3 ubiquitin-protein ligase RNF14-like [Salarias fasciatus]|uniref:E3 ubiquitin-protein ligase RNF14-like n=1 Tax=Salarias fasciatus TaxID=181472 RepID=UPI001176CF19|nr:E3 ubiquitin-protein ligase RNF14-like [Salarias fasciatus]